MNKFLIINPFGIGDCLFTTPIIKALKDRYPNSFIGYWCNERTGGLLAGNAKIDRIFALSRGDIKRVYKGLKGPLALLNLIRQIRAEKFDTAFDFSLDSRYGLWSKLAGIKKRIGFNYKGRGRFLTDKIGLKGYSGRHVVDYYLDLLKFVFPDPACNSRKLHYQAGSGIGLDISKENAAKVKSMLAGFNIKPADLLIGIAMGGGASWGRDAFYKQWPAERFGQLAEELIKEKGARIVLLGSADEKSLAQTLIKGQSQSVLIRHDGTVPMVDFTGKLSLEELAAVIKEFKLLICNDGGPLHMAVALGISTVSIFGPVDEKVYGPYPSSEKHIVIKKDIPCRPCYKDFRFPGCSNDRRCLEDITVEEVWEGVKKILCVAT